MRSATIERETRETRITLKLELDGSGLGRRKTGVGFLDHMLDLFAFH
ncbi:MAG: imidazoleglycerol-phosphate dehydratase, partial [Lawsonibacter sp.]